MTIYYGITGAERKKLAAAVGEFAGTAPVYQYMPTCSYAVDLYTITREGNLEFSDRTDSEQVERLIDFLDEHGYRAIPVETEATTDADESESDKPAEIADTAEEVAPAPTETPLKRSESEGEEVSAESETAQPVASGNNLTEADRLTISLPLDGLTETSLENLKRLVESKKTLLMHSIGTDALPIEISEDKVEFPWFPFTAEPEEIEAYSYLVTALCKMARYQRRITAKDSAPENQKYAFRCFLLRLGFVGDQYKSARKILLRNLPGNSAFRKAKPNKGGQPNANSD
ncbi:MAG: virulence protein [Clostridiales bacterium]|nr:virulence protein [Clostridiales bacterium]